MIVVNHLVWNAERGEDDSGIGCGLSARARGRALAQLCAMAPGHALAVRARCVEACRLPALAVSLTLDHAATDTTESNNDVVSYFCIKLYFIGFSNIILQQCNIKLLLRESSPQLNLKTYMYIYCQSKLL